MMNYLHLKTFWSVKQHAEESEKPKEEQKKTVDLDVQKKRDALIEQFKAGGKGGDVNQELKSDDNTQVFLHTLSEFIIFLDMVKNLSTSINNLSASNQALIEKTKVLRDLINKTFTKERALWDYKFNKVQYTLFQADVTTFEELQNSLNLKLQNTNNYIVPENFEKLIKEDVLLSVFLMINISKIVYEKTFLFNQQKFNLFTISIILAYKNYTYMRQTENELDKVYFLNSYSPANNDIINKIIKNNNLDKIYGTFLAIKELESKKDITSEEKEILSFAKDVIQQMKSIYLESTARSDSQPVSLSALCDDIVLLAFLVMCNDNNYLEYTDL